mmetsp:Transcript_4188/g.11975  ORF Transcript_4188/g.11975 Transcript_4188/m.11975 type:complete len:373 (+) Transcript_4188:166-1284(+)|eukprot:CAMPEP_0119545618 /NCGR_PEP_ID=MMETSP1352-20130426/317_1 /TAXON_ID=265584 /ORGANISM="Stauroneis constricta, Strain CCMP1120" /LENGTH=372 /DNA_ID=CAMNT_0007590191 /DNA_START=146 /DNA_END=1264 /DNA_ORIENTATION=+
MCIYDVYGPCSCPHGRCFTLLAQCFTISSFVTSVICITSCFYMFVRPIPEEGEAEAPREGFGYVSRQAGMLEPTDYQTCVYYNQDELSEYFDGMWRAGKAMAFIACIVGGMVMCVVLCTCCVAFELQTFDGLFWTCIFCFVCQSLTFLAWGSNLCDDYECTWSTGTGMNITAAMLWIWAANMIKSFPEALPPRGRAGNAAADKEPMYEDDPNMVYDDGSSPYMTQSHRDMYQDEYTDGSNSYGDASRSFRSQGSQYTDTNRGDETYYSGQDDQTNVSESQRGGNPYNNYVNNDYDDPAERRTHYEDDDFSANSHFRDSWKSNPAEQEQDFDSKHSGSANYFQDDPSAAMSEQEREFMEASQDQSSKYDYNQK